MARYSQVFSRVGFAHHSIATANLSVEAGQLHRTWVAELPLDFQPEALGRIAAMKAAVEADGKTDSSPERARTSRMPTRRAADLPFNLRVTPDEAGTPGRGIAFNALVQSAKNGDAESPGTSQPTAIATWQNWRVSIPEFPTDARGMIDAPLQKVLAATAARNRVTYLGDDHSMRSIRRLLQSSAGAVKEAGVNTLFVEFIHQEDNETLQRFMQTGDSQAFLASLGEHSWKNRDLIDTLEAFRRVGIKAIGIDVQADSRSDHKASMQERNLAWATTINDTIGAEPDTKALVWGGAFHFDLRDHKTSVNSLLPGPIITFVDTRHIDIHSPGQAAYCTTGISNIMVNP